MGVLILVSSDHNSNIIRKINSNLTFIALNLH